MPRVDRLEFSAYERVRENPARFVVAAGHLWSRQAEHVVEKDELYWVVEKVGIAAEAAEEVDPRS